MTTTQDIRTARQAATLADKTYDPRQVARRAAMRRSTRAAALYGLEQLAATLALIGDEAQRHEARQAAAEIARQIAA